MYYTPNYMKQYDKKWSSYGSNGVTIGSYGCGPACIANAVSALGSLNQPNLTPVDVYDWLSSKGLIVQGGTYDSGITSGLQHYGIKQVDYTRSWSSVESALKRGDWVIACVGPGAPGWAVVGHFILAFRLPNGTDNWISDPNHNGHAQQRDATLQQLRDRGDRYWIIKDISSYSPTGGGVSPMQFTGNSVSVDWTKLSPRLAVLDRNSPSIDLSSFSQTSGVLIEAGSLFSKTHRKYEIFRNPKAYDQVELAIKHNRPFGYYMPIRANSAVEAEEEIYELSFLVRKYPPKLGVWLNLELGGSITFKNNMLKIYQRELIRLGLIDKIGIRTTRSGLKLFSWDKFQNDWWLWIVDRVKDISQVNSLLNPEFFDTDGKSG